MPSSRQRLYASLMLLGVALLFVRTLVMFAQGALDVLMPWAGALLIFESILDAAALAAGARWWVRRSPEHAPLALRLTAAVVVLHAIRVLVYVLGRTGPWVDFDRRLAFRGAFEPAWGWLVFASIASVLALLGVVLVARARRREAKRGSLPIMSSRGEPIVGVDPSDEFGARVKRFLDQRKIAVVGVSDRRETGCNLAYQRFEDAGYDVWPVNPRLNEFRGQPCFADLASLPEVPDAVFIFTSPGVTQKVVDECIELGVRHVWMHCMMGTKPGLAPKITSVSPEAVRACEAHGIEVIPGACPNQFIRPDVAHGIMRRLWSALGYLRIEPSKRAEPREGRERHPSPSAPAPEH